MKFNKNLAAIHGYLCGDGYVIRNSPAQKHKYYHIGLRNTNSVLLEDFQTKFENVFGIKPIITNEGRCRIQNKDIYFSLTKDFSYYSYEWKMPRLSKENLKFWLRAFFDCEGWVENQPKKSRLIGLECCNEKGIFQIKEALLKLGINSEIQKKKNRVIWRLTICGKGNIILFQNLIGFLHPDKRQKLQKAINSFINYEWIIPDNKDELLNFILLKGKFRQSRKEFKILSINKQNLQKIRKALKEYKINSTLLGPWKSSTGSQYYCLKIREEENIWKKNIKASKAVLQGN